MEEVPLQIRSLIIVGNKRTNATVIEDELQDVYKAKTFGEISQSLSTAMANIKALDIFDKISCKLEPAPLNFPHQTDLVIKLDEKSVLGLSAGTYVQRNEVSVEGTGVLRNLLGLGDLVNASFVQAQTGSNSLNISASKPRLYGTDLKFEASYRNVYSNLTRFSSLSKHERMVTVGTKSRDGLHHAYFESGLRDIIPAKLPGQPFAYDASLSVIADSIPSFKSSIGYTLRKDTRDTPVMPTTGALKHLGLEVAGGGLIGDAHFMKAEAQLQKHWTIDLLRLPWPYPTPRSKGSTSLSAAASPSPSSSSSSSATATTPAPSPSPSRQSSAKSGKMNENGGGGPYLPASFGLAGYLGVIRPFSSPSSSSPILPGSVKGGYISDTGAGNWNTTGTGGVHLADRFFAGGPVSLRGFDFCGIGPRAPLSEGGAITGDALGGELTYRTTASVTAPLPVATNIRCQLFANAGSLLRWPGSAISSSGSGGNGGMGGSGGSFVSHPFQVGRALLATTRLSAGIGLVVNLGTGRLELNYSVPILKSPNDVTRPMQLGLGIEFN